MDESKWCPMAANCDMPHCERDGCAWWINGRCAIVAIAENLKKLDNPRPSGKFSERMIEQ